MNERTNERTNGRNTVVLIDRIETDIPPNGVRWLDFGGTIIKNAQWGEGPGGEEVKGMEGEGGGGIWFLFDL